MRQFSLRMIFGLVGIAAILTAYFRDDIRKLFEEPSPYRYPPIRDIKSWSEFEQIVKNEKQFVLIGDAEWNTTAKFNIVTLQQTLEEWSDHSNSPPPTIYRWDMTRDQFIWAEQPTNPSWLNRLFGTNPNFNFLHSNHICWIKEGEIVAYHEVVSVVGFVQETESSFEHN